jgi:hypothetical protein
MTYFRLDILRIIRKRFRKNKKYSLLSSIQMEDTADSSSSAAL